MSNTMISFAKTEPDSVDQVHRRSPPLYTDAQVTKFPLPDPAFDDGVSPGAVSVSDSSSSTVETAPTAVIEKSTYCEGEGDSSSTIPRIVGDGSFTRTFSSERISPDEQQRISVNTVASAGAAEITGDAVTQNVDGPKLEVVSEKEANKTTESESNSTITTTTARSTSGRRVTFGDLEVKEFGMILGDHPDVMEGPPLTIDWEPQKTRRFSVDQYESTRSPRREYEDMKFNPIERKMYLRRCVGVPGNEIEFAASRAGDDRRKRIDTIRGLKNEKMDIFIQSLQRKSLRLLERTTHPLRLFQPASGKGGGGGKVGALNEDSIKDGSSTAARSPPQRRSSLSSAKSTTFYKSCPPPSPKPPPSSVKNTKAMSPKPGRKRLH